MNKFIKALSFGTSIFMLLFLSATAHAEKIQLKSGYEVNGEIVERTEEYIKVKIVDDIINTYFVDEIKSIKVDNAGKVASGQDKEASEAAEGFMALHYNDKAVSLGVFTRDGPDENSLQPLKEKIRHIAYDPQTKLYYVLNRHDMGSLSPSDYKYNKIEFDKSQIDVSWPGGIAFDTKRRRVVFTGSSGAGQDIFAYEVDSKQWTTLSENRHTGEGVITYCQENDVFYALPTNHHSKVIKDLLKINSKGAIVKKIPLTEAIPYFGGIDSTLQLYCHQEQLFVMVNQEPHPRLQSPALYQIDPSSGTLEATPYNKGTNLIAKLWPGMPEGPDHSENIAGVCRSELFSNYVTPDNLTKKQTEELHVVSALYGDVNVFKELQRVKQLKVDSQGVEISLDMSKSAMGVNVQVTKTQKPVVLMLISPDNQFMPQTIVWTIEAQAGAQLAKVVMIESKDQRLVGLPDGVPVEKVTLDRYAHAWEIGENKRAEFDRMIKDIRKKIALRESSFQGCTYGKSFTVPFKAQ